MGARPRKDVGFGEKKGDAPGGQRLSGAAPQCPGPCPRRRARPGRSAAGTQMRQQGGWGRAGTRPTPWPSGERKPRRGDPGRAGVEARGPPHCPPGAGSCLPPLGSGVSPAPHPPRPFPGGHLSDVSDSQSPLSYPSNSQWALRLMVRTRAKTRKGRARGATDCSEKEGGGRRREPSAAPRSPGARGLRSDCAGGARAPLHLRRPRGRCPVGSHLPDWLLRSAGCLGGEAEVSEAGCPALPTLLGSNWILPLSFTLLILL